ncbi:MAG: hypothetical protein EPN85_00565 [Bacteroidetes bacterium]|nr:MAG: hypothetical protein EPN85_00565 [Bacteroidota bacterium]
MKIQINDKRKIFAIQEEFGKTFPYLKIEFFAKPHRVGGASSKKIMKHPSKTLGECRTIHSDGIITITSGMTVADLEQNFRDIYGLSVQVFRKSGQAWLETTVTDGWTLEKQNQQGEMLSDFLSQKKSIEENEAAE